MRAKKKYKFEPEYAIPPGETLKELMETLQMTQRELALRLGLTVQTLNRIFNGVQPISYETANRLELVTGTPARIWNNLEMQYQEQMAKREERLRLESDLNWLKSIPVDELIARGLIENQDDKLLTLRSVLAFYGVSNVEAWRNIWDNPGIAARRSSCFETQPGPASAWIRQGEIKAQGKTCRQFNRGKFSKSLSSIQKLTCKTADEFIPEMSECCADAGVALVIVKAMKKVPWSGATKWLSPDKAMILLSLRGKGEDKFWFSFFHESCHLLRGSTKRLYIADESDDPVELEADRFAANFLIPDKFNDKIRICSTDRDICNMASELNIAPGIVAGRYQYLTKKWNYFKGLIRSFEWVES